MIGCNPDRTVFLFFPVQSGLKPSAVWYKLVSPLVDLGRRFFVAWGGRDLLPSRLPAVDWLTPLAIELSLVPRFSFLSAPNAPPEDDGSNHPRAALPADVAVDHTHYQSTYAGRRSCMTPGRE